MHLYIFHNILAHLTLHACRYYLPGSLKAKLCVEGNAKMYAYCDAHGIPYDRCGKVIVAVDATEVPGLQEIYRRGQENGVAGLSWLSAAELRVVEPHCRGVAAVHCSSTGITDYKQVPLRMLQTLC